VWVRAALIDIVDGAIWPSCTHTRLAVDVLFNQQPHSSSFPTDWFPLMAISATPSLYLSLYVSVFECLYNRSLASQDCPQNRNLSTYINHPCWFSNSEPMETNQLLLVSAFQILNGLEPVWHLRSRKLVLPNWGSSLEAIFEVHDFPFKGYF
jgi:hypothetical protein